MPDKVKLNLGCARNATEGYINVDIEKYPGVDLIADLEEDWPWKDDSVDEIVAKDLYEHLKDIIHTMNETWRVLKPGGVAHIYVPTTDSLAAFQDPTHKTFWNANTFLYFVEDGIMDYPAIKAKFHVLAARPYVYNNIPYAKGIYVQLQKPEKPTKSGDEDKKENMG